MKQTKLQVIASLPIYNGLALHIYIDESNPWTDGKIRAGYTGETPRKHKLYYNTKGEAYFKKHGKRFYIDDSMRGNW